MVSPASQFELLVDIYASLALRSDIDNIVLELLGAFSLEKIYADADEETYQFLVITLLAQLSSIFWIQRLSLSAESYQAGRYLGFLISWEVTIRTVEFLLNVVVEGREALWGAKVLRDKYLAEFLLSALRVLTLHPKVPVNQRAKDRRDRFARIHGSLECLYDSYPGQKSFLLLVCKEITDALKRDPNSLLLPPRLRHELPNLTGDLYPLADVLSAQYVDSIVPQDGYSGDWLSQYLALRDVSHFVVGASIQYAVTQKTRDFKPRGSALETRNAVFQALDRIRLPQHLTKGDLVAYFSDIFRPIIPGTPNLVRQDLDTREEEYEWDAISALCLRLNGRQVVNRSSDRELVSRISKVTRSIALMDDPGASFRAPHPKLYVLNCRNCHVVGDSELRQSGDIKFPFDPGSSTVSDLLPTSRCPQCSNPVSIAREISLVRQTWDLLKPLEPNSDAINIERHQPSQFQLCPPKTEPGMPFHPTISSPNQSQRHDFETFSPFEAPYSSQTSQSPLFYKSPDLSLRLSNPQTGAISSNNISSGDGNTRKTSSSTETAPFSPDSFINRTSMLPNIENSATNVSFDPLPPIRTRTVPLTSSQEKKESSSWRSKLTGNSRKQSFAASGDTSSLSSTTIEAQTLEEITLKSLVVVGDKKKGIKNRSTKDINVYLSQNSPHALFWTQLSMHLWDISATGGQGSSVVKIVAIESTCMLAACTKGFLAYVVGTRGMKLTLRIINLLQPTAPAMEYRMPSTPGCKSIAICPSENYVVVGFENALVRFFPTALSSSDSSPREDHIHRHSNRGECHECPDVNTLSFSADGLVLLASTRSQKSGVIQVYQWRFPFLTFSELSSCRYPVPLHESEDAGVSAAIFRSAPAADENLICITTWTQSGAPILIQPIDGHRSLITSSAEGHHGNSRRIGSRIQAASFSPSGRDLALVNEKGHVYVVSRLNSSPTEVTCVATSKELTSKASNFAMSFVQSDDSEAVILTWADASKGVGWIKKIPIFGSGRDAGISPSQNVSIMHIMGGAGHQNQHTTTKPCELPGDEVLDSRHPSLVTMSGGLGRESGPGSSVRYGARNKPMINIQTSELADREDEILPAQVPPWQLEPEVKFLVEEKKVVEKSKFWGRSSRP